VDHLSALVLEAGRGAFLTKADIKEAYRMLPVHPQDHHLLGVHYKGQFTLIKPPLLACALLPKYFQQLLMPFNGSSTTEAYTEHCTT